MKLNRIWIVLLALMLTIVVFPTDSAFASDLVATSGEWQGNDNGIIWTNVNTGYLVFSEADASPRIAWTKTTDGGTTWSSPTTIQGTCDVGAYGVWYDRWTKGSSGTKIHVSWHRNPNAGNVCGANNYINYVALDTANDTLGTIYNYPITVYAGSCQTGSNPCEITVATSRGGYIYIHATLTTSSFQQKFLVSTDGGTSFTNVSLGPSGTAFEGPITPFNADDDILIGDGINVDQDIVAWDYGNLKYLLYDQSANSWITGATFTGLGVNCVPSSVAYQRNCYTRAVNNTTAPLSATGTGAEIFGHLDGTTVCATGGTCNFEVFKIDTAAVAHQMTPVFTGATRIATIGLTFDANADRLYAFYVNSTTYDVFYKTSDDYGDTWSAQQTFDADATGKLNGFGVPTITQSGGQFMPIWMEGGNLVTELASAIELKTTEEIIRDFVDQLTAFVDGLGMRGTSGHFWFATLTTAILFFGLSMFRVPFWPDISVTGMWATGMAVIEYFPPEVYLSALVAIGALTIYVIVGPSGGSDTGEDF